MKLLKLLNLFFILSFINHSNAYSQIISPVGTITRASSQLVSYYDATINQSNNPNGDFQRSGYGEGVLQIANTNETTGVWLHIQLFMSFDADGDLNNTTEDKVICDERNFVDFYTPGDVHIYDLKVESFPKNIGEGELSVGELTSINANGTKGFVVITPVVSESDLTAISFQHLIGSYKDDEKDVEMTMMGRDAVNYENGSIVPDGTPLDGVSNGFVVIQPEEFLFQFAQNNISDSGFDDVGIISFVFQDSYGPTGLLGYQAQSGTASWTSFIFDFKEDPTSCGIRPVNCFFDIGLNDSFPQENEELNPGPAGVGSEEESLENCMENNMGSPELCIVGTDDLLCPGVETPQYPVDPLAGFDEFYGWGQVFVSGLETFENHLAMYYNDKNDGADWMHVRGQRTVVMPDPVVEDCTVIGDEDSDGLTDCADPDCDLDESCENGADECTDTVDNDADGDVDCADAGCDGIAAGPENQLCESAAESSCDDGFDNDGDGLVDCDDEGDCSFDAACIVNNDDGNGGCKIASRSVSSGLAIVNFLLPIIAVGFAFGIRRIRR